MNKNQIKNNYKERINFLDSKFQELNSYEIENLVEHSMCTNVTIDFDSIILWAKKVKDEFNTEISEIPLDKLQSWNVSKKNISHSSGKFFEILGLRVGSDAGREISGGWDQPIVKEYNFDGGVLGLIRTYIDELPHYLVQARFEPGNYGPIQISPTLQATFSNLNQEHGGRKPHYHEFFNDYKDTSNYLFNAWLSEDGGKFYKKSVKNIFPDDEGVKLYYEEATHKFDKLVLCAGAWSKVLTKTYGDNFPLDTERGYHVLFNNYNLINRPIGWSQSGFYLVQLEEGLRAAGTVEIGGLKKPENKKRTKMIEMQARKLLPQLKEVKSTWLGFRPTLPDSLPVIGQSAKYKNIIYGFGHQHIGWTLGAVTGKVINSLCNDRVPNINIEPFSPKRFN